jgi:hypothetical protein
MPTGTKPPPMHTTGLARQVKEWYLGPARDEKDRYIITGSIAALIFFVIDVVTGGGVGSAVALAVIIGLVTIIVSFVISRTIIASMRKRT